MLLKYLLVLLAIIATVILVAVIYRALAKPATQTAPAVGGDPVITLDRTTCYGTCPAYTVTIYDDGRVHYEGYDFVKVKGKQTDQIATEKVQQLVDAFLAIDYFALEDRYDQDVTDVPTVTTSITLDGKTKRVENRFDGPEKLRDLQNKIDEIVGTEKWVGKR